MPNTNPEYQRLKAILDSNTDVRMMLEAISKAEGTARKNKDDAYSVKYGGGIVSYNSGKDTNILKGSSAHGKYQFMNGTWSDLSKSLGLEDFGPESQDVAAVKLLEESGALDKILEGDLENAVYKASSKWAALPKDKSGQSGLTFADKTPQKAKPIKTILGYFNSNESARAKANKEYQSLNEKNLKATSYEQGEQDKANFLKELSVINQGSGTEAEKNLKKQAVKQRYYREGKLLNIQNFLVSENKQKLTFDNEIKKIREKIIRYNGHWGTMLDMDGRETEHAGKRKLYEEIKKDYLFLGKELKSKGKELPETIDKNNYEAIVRNTKNPFRFVPIEKGILKYGKTKQEFDAEKENEVFVNENAGKEVAKEEVKASDITPVPETQEEKAKREESVKIEKARVEDLINKKAYEGKDAISQFDKAPMVDSTFKYKKGKNKFPFESLIGLTTGLVGAAAADSVKIDYRDEQISEGIKMYAKDVAKIAKMGLPPDIEGGLKMRLADAYQTGITNIVKASNGNRNLVLGNQGQLDKARMAGIVDITVADVKRSDDAMVIFGEIQKYINDFDSKRDIANNERKYGEDQLLRTAGATLAQQGMSNFISAIENSKENAPGSMNDYKRQYFQFLATGISPGAEEGTPGSASYRANIVAKNNAKEARKETYRNWINTKPANEQKLINDILIKNPQFANFEDDDEEGLKNLQTEFDKVNGSEENRKAFYADKPGGGIGELTVTQAQKDAESPVEDKTVATSNTTSTNYVPIDRTTPVVPKKHANIFTAEKFPESIMMDQLTNGLNGKEQGINTIDPQKLEAEKIQEENMSGLINTQK